VKSTLTLDAARILTSARSRTTRATSEVRVAESGRLPDRRGGLIELRALDRRARHRGTADVQEDLGPGLRRARPSRCVKTARPCSLSYPSTGAPTSRVGLALTICGTARAQGPHSRVCRSLRRSVPRPDRARRAGDAAQYSLRQVWHSTKRTRAMCQMARDCAVAGPSSTDDIRVRRVGPKLVSRQKSSPEHAPRSGYLGRHSGMLVATSRRSYVSVHVPVMTGHLGARLLVTLRKAHASPLLSHRAPWTL
jgi:hypothetical protein